MDTNNFLNSCFIVLINSFMLFFDKSINVERMHLNYFFVKFIDKNKMYNKIKNIKNV